MGGWLTWRNERRWLATVLALAIAAVVLGVVAWAMKASSDAERAYTHPKDLVREPIPWSPPSVDGRAGQVDVSIQPVEGLFIEGFQVGLRFEDGDGKVLDSAYWSDVVHSLVDEPAPEDFYATVMHEPVPAGTAVVRAEVTLGSSGPPPDPDLSGSLPCAAKVPVAAGETVRVEVRFDSERHCVALLPPASPASVPTTTTSAVGG